ncbi:MAG: hypothetical protein WBI40_13045 [Methylococcaceae bacterium]
MSRHNSKFSYHLSRLDVVELFKDFLRERRCYCKIPVIDILKANADYALTKKKKLYPYLQFKKLSNGAERYRQADCDEWFYTVFIHLEKSKLITVA